MNFTVTLAQLRKEGACIDGYNKLVCSLQGKPFDDDAQDRNSYIRYAYKEPVSLLHILDSNGLDDALWCLRCLPEHSKLWRLYAVWCARQVQHLMKDRRSIDALDVAERHAHGQASDVELDAARAAARAAAWDAARDAARAAAWDAAWDAARAAAWDAARAAAWDAARDAAWAAEWDAAWDAARAAQAAKLREVLTTGAVTFEDIKAAA
jgi:hypothetical protein